MRRPRLLRNRRTFALALASLALAATAIGWFVVPWLRDRVESARAEATGDFTRMSLARSGYLRDLVEPIAFTDSASRWGSDDTWEGVTFSDRRGTERTARYIFTWPDVHNTLMLGQTRVPPRGDDERAFLGLLQRWYRLDTEVAGLVERYRRLRDDPARAPDFSNLKIDYSNGRPIDHFTKDEWAKLIAVNVMHDLEKRYQGP